MTANERDVLRQKTEEAIKNKGFYGSNGVWNSIITFSNDPHIYRHRVETIVVRNNKEIYVKKKPNGEYFLPGGSTEREIPNIKQAENECREEAHISIKNIEPTGYTYKEVTGFLKWAENEHHMIRWDGRYTEIFIAEYDKPYRGHVDKVDEDPFIKSGRWYSKKECLKFFRKEHREALMEWLKRQKEEPVQESYITNYFGNKLFLRKINKSPEIARDTLEYIIEILIKNYKKMIKTPKIQKEMKSKDVENIFHPILTIDFPDGCTIAFALSFDTSSITDGAALYSESYGNVVIIFPCFFDTKNIENQIFTILHEIGHIRLGHVYDKHSLKSLFGQDLTNIHRLNMMSKGKAMYPEINADMYAILNGGKLYTILGSSIQQDQDEQYDYRFTNSELATRYNDVWKKYRKLRPNEFSPFETEVASLIKGATYTAIYEMCDYTELEEKEKDSLYNFMVEYYINKPNRSFFEDVKYENPFSFFDEKKEEIKEDIYEAMLSIKEELKKNSVITENSSELITKYCTLLESLSSKERKSISLEKFGIPEERKYPLDTKKHVQSAIRLFGHCDEKYRKELAKNILKAMKKFDIPRDFIGPKSSMQKYI